MFLTNRSFAKSEILLLHTWHEVGGERGRGRGNLETLRCKTPFLESPAVVCLACCLRRPNLNILKPLNVFKDLKEPSEQGDLETVCSLVV